MKNRFDEINSLSKESFQKLLRAARKDPAFVHRFNWGIEGLSSDEKESLKNTFLEFGLSAPIDDDDLEAICTAIDSRCISIS